MMCGIRAVVISIEQQHPHLPVPTEGELEDVLSQVQDVNYELGEEGQWNTNNFFVDQLGTILFGWGEARGMNLRLGYVLADGHAFLVGTPRDGEDPVTVWIHSSRTTGATGDEEMDHYSGLAATEGDEHLLPVDGVGRDGGRGGGAEKDVLEGNAGGVREAGARGDGDRGSGDRRREEGARC